ncbi:MAG: gluconate 2-dehydrogenase subunit 3 family protein [Myxococcaceae bacterium]|nr:gluconate 2-dehydrogenase subunit 3 family protein [Myxococcaceae bacterium]
MGTDSRRGLLKKGLLGGAVLALGGGGGLFLLPGRLEPLPSGGLKVLDQREYSVFAALARRLVPSTPGVPSVDELEVAKVCDTIVSQTDPTAQAEVKQLLQLFERALPNLLFGGRVSAFTSLSPEAQDEVLGEWRRSSILLRRTGFLALRAVVMGATFAQPRTWPLTGYPGPPSGFHQADAPHWVGGGTPRPDGNGVWREPT